MQRWQRRLWISGVAFGASFIILLGLLVGAFRLAVQLVPDYRADVEARVSELFQSPVAIEEMDLIWRGRYPTLQLRQVEVGEPAQGGLQLAELRLGFSLLRLLHGDTMPRRVQMRGTSLQITLLNGEFKIGGLQAESSTPQAPQAFLDQLRDIGRIELEDARLRWIDRDHGRPPKDLHLLELQADSTFSGMQLELQARLPEQEDSLVEARLELRRNPWRLRELDLDLSHLNIWDDLHALIPGMPRLRGDLRQLRLRGEWRDGQWASGRADFDLRDLRPAQSPQGIKQWQGSILLSAEREGYRGEMSIERLQTAQAQWPAQLLTLEWQPGESEIGRLSLNAPYLRLQDIETWTAAFPTQWLEHWRAWQPSGEVRQLLLQTSGTPQSTRVAFEFDGLGWQANASVPGMQGLSGSLSMDADSGQVSIDSSGAELEAPNIFAQSLPLDQLSGNLSWSRLADGWRLQGPGLHYSSLGLDGVGRLVLDLGPSRRIDLDLNFFCPDPQPWLSYQPVFWRSSLQNWLRRAIGPAKVSSGRLQLRGDLADFPYPGSNKGLFQLDLELEDAELKFAPDWPLARLDQARLLIEGSRLEVQAPSGRIGELQARKVRAILPSFQESELSVEADLAGDAGAVWGMLGRSKLRRHMSQALDALRLAGPMSAHLALELPLRELEQTEYQVDARFDRAALWTSYWPDPIKKIRGRLQVGPDGLRAQELSGELEGIPLRARLLPEDGKTRLEASFSASAQSLPASVPLPAWLKKRAVGESEWQFLMEIGPGARQGLEFESNLLGMRWELPAPFAKSEDELRRLNISIEPAERTRIHISYAQLLGLDLRLGKAGAGLEAARLHFGRDVMPAGAPGWWIEGGLAQASLDDWLPLITDLAASFGESSGSTMEFGGLVLELGSLQALGQRFNDMQLELDELDDLWRLKLAGAKLAGQLDIRPNSGQRLRLDGQFDRLNWTREAGSVGNSGSDPTSIPELHLRANEFSLNDVQLGSLRLDLTPVNLGSRIEKLSLEQAGRQELQAEGLWLRDKAGESAALNFKLDTQRFARWLTALGYQDNLTAQRGRIEGQLNWSPSPQGLAFKALSGDLNFEFTDGQLLNVEPGAGRVLGLFSINALPRRFFLDFRDVVDTGLGFDSMGGSFRLDQGLARTEDFLLKGPSLRIAARGAVDLVKREYDQVITIYPGLSSGVSLAATLLGGPVVGLFTLLAQELLDKPLDQVTQISYQLAGSWDNPKVSRLE